MFDFMKKKESYTAPVEEPVAEVVEPEIKETDLSRTLIGSEVKFTGNIEATEDIEIRGSVTGNIKSTKNVTVTREGSVKGNIRTQTLVIEGKTEGTHRVEDSCKIASNGSHNGEMYVSTLTTEDGSEFEGTLHLKKKVISFNLPAHEPGPEPKVEEKEIPAK